MKEEEVRALESEVKLLLESVRQKTRNLEASETYVHELQEHIKDLRDELLASRAPPGSIGFP